MNDFEELAAEMLTLMPSLIRLWRGGSYGMTMWICRLYGYDVAMRRWLPNSKSMDLEGVYTRNDEPGARRRAEWMRNPAADPTYPPPVAWHLDGGPGFTHPAGTPLLG